MLASNLLNQSPARGGRRGRRAARRNAVRAQTLLEKRRLLAAKKKRLVKAERDKFGNIWKMRKAQLLVLFQRHFR